MLCSDWEFSAGMWYYDRSSGSRASIVVISTVNPRYNDSMVPNDVAIIMNLLL